MPTPYYRRLSAIIRAMDKRVLDLTTHPNPFADLIGLRFDSWGDGESVCSIELEPRLMNPNGVLHGAVVYALADTGMGGALLSALEGGRICATIEIKTSYFRSVTAGRLTCRSWIVYQGRRTAFLESTVDDADGPVARATGTFAILEPRRVHGVTP